MSLFLSMKRKIWRYAPLFIWIGIIFYLSSSQGSMSQTSRFIRPLLEFIFPQSPEEFYLSAHAFIRKFAHVAVYFTLACFAASAFASSSKDFFKKFWYLAALAIVLIIASLDEFNQSFNALRTGTPRDVLIDFSGGTTAILLIALLRKIFRRKTT